MPENELKKLAQEHRLRRLPDEREGKLEDLCSNDYLGLSLRANEYREEYMARWGDAPMSASASRLLASRQKHHGEYEDYLSELYGKEALIFNSGYHANTGILSSLMAIPGTVVVADKLIHASAIDGMRIGGGEIQRFRHNDTGHLRKIICKLLDRSDVRRVTVAVESVYSMDGDHAPLQELVGLKREFPGIMLYVDEAHAFGVHGERGLGLCEEEEVIGEIDIIMATLGKAAASQGAFAITDTSMHDWLVNTSRSLIFSTALPPASVGWSHLMTEKITGMQEERTRLKIIGTKFARMIEEVTGQDTNGGGHIQPLLTGNAERALALSEALRECGFDVLAIRRPTVPPGGERLRFSLNAALEEDTVERLKMELSKFFK